MEFVVENGVVYKIEYVDTGNQVAEIKTYNDMEIHTKLEYDPAAQKITATVYNYLGDVQTEYAGPVPFFFDEQTIELAAVAGVAVIDFVVDVPGQYYVCTAISMARNGEVIVYF